jgi:Arc/MetJ family transcription regulator
MMDELIAAVARAARLSPEQAALAVAAMLRFLTARLPSSLVGELHARLQTRAHDPAVARPPLGVADDPEPTR